MKALCRKLPAAEVGGQPDSCSPVMSEDGEDKMPAKKRRTHKPFDDYTASDAEAGSLP